MAPNTDSIARLASRLPASLAALTPGFLVSLVIAVAAQFLSDHYGAPAMLMALLLGIAFHFLAEEGRCVEGINLTARAVLRFGVALLGVRISVDLLIGLGPELIALVVAGVILTILFGLLAARFLGRGWRFALLTSGAVAICGASAAMAIAAVLPKNEQSERNLIFTVLGVTVLSTLAMILYPLMSQLWGSTTWPPAYFWAERSTTSRRWWARGFSISETAGDTATLVKLIRVTLLAPAVLTFSLCVRHFAAAPDPGTQRPPLLPGFVVAFLALAAINSFGLIPAVVANALADLSRWALLTAIAAVGMKTSLKAILDVGAQAIILITAETIFICAVMLAGLAILAK